MMCMGPTVPSGLILNILGAEEASLASAGAFASSLSGAEAAGAAAFSAGAGEVAGAALSAEVVSPAGGKPEGPILDIGIANSLH